MSVLPGERGVVDPEYFSLGVRRALRESTESDRYLDDCLAGVSGPAEELLAEEFLSLADHPEAVEAGVAIAEAESAVLCAEDAGIVDELAMRRLDKARAAERAVMARLQQRRTVAHSERAVSRTTQVIPMRRRSLGVAGGEVA